jgi:PadR family transcriptional regulator, regulatory protein PadR
MQNNDKMDFPRLSRKESLILEMLVSSTCEIFGLEMVKASKGALKRGTVYVTLKRMEDKGLIESRTEARTGGEIGIPRRLYRITGHGQRVLAAMKAAQTMVFAV